MRAARSAHARWFGPVPVCVAWLALIVALVHPPHGTGVQVCWTRAMTGLPCPGCGMTRALSSAARGMLEQSWHHHPFGMPLLALFVFTAGLSLLPGAARRRFAARVMRHHRLANGAYVTFVTAFVAYGVARSVLHLVG